MQPDFTLALLSRCRKMGINTAIETCAYGDYSVIEKLLPYLDVIYADLKIMDAEQHKKYTGFSNETILANIRRIAEESSAGSFAGKLRIRIPLVPTVNMDDANIKAAAAFCKSLAKLDFVEFLPYHRLGIDSYRKLGREFLMNGIMPPGKHAVAKVKRIFEETGPGIQIINNK